MASDREKRKKLEERLNKLGEEWYAIDSEASPAEKKNKYDEIVVAVYKLFVPASFSSEENFDKTISDSTDKKLNILYYILYKNRLKNFDPSVRPLSHYISYIFKRRDDSSDWKSSFKSAGSKKDKNTLPASSLTNSEGNEIDLESYLALVEKDIDCFQTIQPQLDAEAVEKLHFALEIMEQTFLLQEPAKKISESKKRIYQLLFSSRLIDIAKMQVIRNGLKHEREFMSHANHKFFVFCFDSKRQRYVSLNELEDTPLKTNRVVYQLAEQHGIHYALKENLADHPIYVPIPNNICIMFLGCEEGVTISDAGVSQYWKQFKKEIEAIRKQ